MTILDIIEKKKNKLELSNEDISFFITNLDSFKDYQISALLMAIVINGMSEAETICLTKEMTDSGDCVTLPFQTVDKHSTGGIGDKVSLIVGPIVACAHCRLAKMSGRGLGYTGGTIDKLESVGVNTSLTEEEFIDQAKKINIAIMGQTKNIAPADKKLYHLRDVTGTVESIPLIAASIMSKKIASGAKTLLLDVKVGSGAFMKNIKDAKKLAKLMVKIGSECGIKTRAILSNMDIPLGSTIGNRLEVREAVEVLSGKGNEELRDLCITIASQIISLRHNMSLDKSEEIVLQILEGDGLNKLREFISYQGGNIHLVDEVAKYRVDVRSKFSGYVTSIDALQMGKLSLELGAGRKTLEDKIDFNAGIVINKHINDEVKIGDVLFTMFSDSPIEAKGVPYKIGEKSDFTLIHDVVE